MSADLERIKAAVVNVFFDAGEYYREQGNSVVSFDGDISLDEIIKAVLGALPEIEEAKEAVFLEVLGR